MNIRFVANQLGVLLLAMAAGFVGLAAFAGVSARLAEDGGPEAAAAVGFLVSAAAGLAAGGGLWLSTRNTEKRLGRREALLLVGLTWLVGGALAPALPTLGGPRPPPSPRISRSSGSSTAGSSRSAG